MFEVLFVVVTCLGLKWIGNAHLKMLPIFFWCNFPNVCSNKGSYYSNKGAHTESPHTKLWLILWDKYYLTGKCQHQIHQTDCQTGCHALSCYPELLSLLTGCPVCKPQYNNPGLIWRQTERQFVSLVTLEVRCSLFSNSSRFYHQETVICIVLRILHDWIYYTVGILSSYHAGVYWKPD